MIPDSISTKDILNAIEYVNNNGVPDKRRSTKYDLVFDGKTYPPKYVVSQAARYATGKELPPDMFNGGKETNEFLEDKGFEVRLQRKTAL